MPTCESVMWLSFLAHQKISLQVGQTEYSIMGPLLFQFDVLLNEYIAYKESKEQNKVVPFNKYLFQKCKQKGCFYKASYIVRDVIDEMIAREKQQTVNHQYSVR